MMTKNKNKIVSDMIARRAMVFKALGHPTRLRMVEMLRNGELCVCKFQEAFSIDFSTISRHLAILKKAEILTREKRGKQVFYALQCEEVLHLLDWLPKNE